MFAIFCRYCAEHSRKALLQRQKASQRPRPHDTPESLLEDLDMYASRGASDNHGKESIRRARSVDSIASKVMGTVTFKHLIIYVTEEYTFMLYIPVFTKHQSFILDTYISVTVLINTMFQSNSRLYNRKCVLKYTYMMVQYIVYVCVCHTTM